MKKYLLLICLFAVGLSSCRKKIDDLSFDTAAQAVIDDQVILDYFLLNGMTVPTKDPSGLYYIIDNPGTGAHPTVNSNVTVNYQVFNTSDQLIDAGASNYYAPLSGVAFEAWKIALPKIGKGGSITIYSPSGLAFGPNGSGSVSANQVLIFKIGLQGFNN